MGTLQSVSNDPPASDLLASREIAPVETETPTVTVPPAAGAKPVFPIVAPRSSVNVVTIASAFIILALFACLFNYMLNVGVPSKEYWDRYLALYNSVQAIVAAAVGALLGAQVTAGQAVVARAEVNQAKERTAQLEANIKAFQSDVASTDRTAESGAVAGRERLLVRAMTLLH